jgi:hypothetical protein
MPTVTMDEETKKQLDWYLIELANQLKLVPTYSRAVSELLKEHAQRKVKI